MIVSDQAGISQFHILYFREFMNAATIVVPIHLSKYHKEMLVHCKEKLEYRDGYVAIHPKHSKLITALRTAAENSNGMLVKEASHDDCFDVFSMSMQCWS